MYGRLPIKVILAILSINAPVLNSFLIAPHSTKTPTVVLESATAAEQSKDTTADDEELPLLIQATLGKKTTRTPVWMMRQAGRHMACYRELVKKYPTFRQRSEIPDVAVEISLQPVNQYDTDGCILFSDILTPLPAMGCEFQIEEKRGPVMKEAVRDKDSFEKIMASRTFDPSSSLSFVGEILTTLRSELPKEKAMLGFVGCPYTLATYIVEGGSSKLYIETKKMACEQPELFHSMLKLLAENIGQYACYQIESGAQLIQIFDSWAGELNTRDYDEFAAPYQKMVLDIIKEKYPHIPTVIYIKHSGSLIERMAKTGVDVVSLDWTVDLAEGRERVNAARSEIGLSTAGGVQGNLDPTMLLMDSKDAIKERTEDILRKGGGVGHVMNLGHGIEAMTSEENAQFFIDTVRNFRHD